MTIGHDKQTYISASRLARRTTLASLGAALAGLEPNAHRPSTWRYSRRRQPMAQTRPRRWRTGTAPPHCPWTGATPLPDQLPQLPELLNRGPQAYGLRGQRWICARVGVVIRRTFGVSYHPARISRLMGRIRFSLPRPIRRARQRKDAAIQAWRDT
jgi:transposase